jgi:hypothetical protein
MNDTCAGRIGEPGCKPVRDYAPFQAHCDDFDSSRDTVSLCDCRNVVGRDCLQNLVDSRGKHPNIASARHGIARIADKPRAAGKQSVATTDS